MSRLLVRAAEAWIRKNPPDSKIPYKSTHNGFLHEAETAYFEALKEHERRSLREQERRHTPWLPSRAWIVYMLHGKDGRIFYVGMTGRPKARIREHVQEFGDRLDWVDYQRFDSRVQAYDAETAFIAALRPSMNVSKVPR